MQTACQSRRGLLFCNLHRVDEIPCAANQTPGQPACTRRDDHLTTCEHQRDGDCPGCALRPAVHGYLCRRHYERWERAWTALGRLRTLLAEDVLWRARTALSSASTTAGPRVPLSSLQLDVDELDRAWSGDPTTHDGAIAALVWAHDVHVVAGRHPVEPKRERLHRVRCGACEQVAVVVDPPEIAGGDSTLRCVQCGWTTRDQDHAEAAAYTEALERNPYRPRRIRRAEPKGLDALAGVAALVRALR